MKTGTVVSYSEEKRYGFIRDDDGDSVFFHRSAVASDALPQIKKGVCVTFTEVPSRKGTKAENVDIAQLHKLYETPRLDGDFLISKTEACGRNNEPVMYLGAVTVESQDPDEAVRLLQSKAMAVGCNAILCLNRGRQTGSDGNYKFTIHQFTAYPALIKRVRFTSDGAEAKRSAAAMAEECERIRARPRPTNSLMQSSHLGLAIMIGFVALILGIMFGAFS